MAQSNMKRLNVEYPREALRDLELYCNNGFGVSPTGIMRALLAEFLAQIGSKLHEGARPPEVAEAIPIVVTNVRQRLERTDV